MPSSVVERAMTDAEFSWLCARLNEHTVEHGDSVQTHEQHGFVALLGDTFVGCASGRIYREDGVPTGWFYLSDLFVEAPYRQRGLGALLPQNRGACRSHRGTEHLDRHLRVRSARILQEARLLRFVRTGKPLPDGA